MTEDQPETRPAPTLDPSYATRLCLARQVLLWAREQSQRPPPLAQASILTAHDAIELFLGAACQKAAPSTSTKRAPDWGQYLDTLAKAGVLLPYAPAMIELNNCRIGLKHYGTVPSTASVREHLMRAEAFLAEGTKQVFGVAFSELRMSNFVRTEAIRQRVRAAEDDAERNEMPAAVADLAVAFFLLRRVYHRWRGYCGPSLGGFPRSRDSRRAYEEFSGAVAEISERLQVLELPLDHPRLVRFLRIAPQVYSGVERDEPLIVRQAEQRPVSREAYDEAYDFVVTSILRTEEMLGTEELPGLE